MRINTSQPRLRPARPSITEPGALISSKSEELRDREPLEQYSSKIDASTLVDCVSFFSFSIKATRQFCPSAVFYITCLFKEDYETPILMAIACQDREWFVNYPRK